MIDWGLYVVTDRKIAGKRDIAEVVLAAIKGGATVIQMREKESSARDMIDLGKKLQKIAAPRGVPFIVNDRADVAFALNADGVHVGQDDMPLSVVRRILGKDKIIGVSARTVSQALEAQSQGADYIGAGDIFGTKSKPDAGEAIGIGTLSAIVKAVHTPVVGIGGISKENAAEVIKAGAAGLAVISAVVGAENPEKAAKDLSYIIKMNRKK